jgi:hypothetical protein
MTIERNMLDQVAAAGFVSACGSQAIGGNGTPTCSIDAPKSPGLATGALENWQYRTDQ